MHHLANSMTELCHFTGDEVLDELMRGYASLLREKGGSSVVAGVPQVYQTHIQPCCMS